MNTVMIMIDVPWNRNNSWPTEEQQFYLGLSWDIRSGIGLYQL
jgi:hypothetical protein